MIRTTPEKHAPLDWGGIRRRLATSWRCPQARRWWPFHSWGRVLLFPLWAEMKPAGEGFALQSEDFIRIRRCRRCRLYRVTEKKTRR